MRVAGGENSGHGGTMHGVGGNVAPTVQVDAEIDEQFASDWPRESHRQKNQVRVQVEFGTRHAREVSAPVGEHLPLETDRVDSPHSAILAGKSGGRDAPIPFGALLMCVARTKLHWPERPRRARRATDGRLRQKFELPDAFRSLTNARTGAVGPGVAAA